MAIRFSLLQVCPSVSPFVFAMLFIPSFNVVCLTPFGGSFYRFNFEKFRDTGFKDSRTGGLGEFGAYFHCI